MTQPGLKALTLVYTASLGADVTLAVGGFANDITIRRFIETAGADSTGTTALNIDDGGTDGSGTTAIADKTAGAFTKGTPVKTEADDTNAADGYKLTAGHSILVAIDWSTTAVTGYTLVMEYVEGIG